MARSEVLRKTRLIDGFFGGDQVFLAEVALLGQIVQLDEPLLRKRLLPGRSMAANKTREEFAGWYDSSAEPGWLGHADRIDVEIMRSIWRLRLPWTARCRCTGALLTGSRAQRTRWSRWQDRWRRLRGGPRRE